MAQIAPFRGVRYNQKKVTIAQVAAPPYDVISPKEHDMLYKKNAYNIVRLILGKEQTGDTASNNKYTRAGQFFDDWKKQNIVMTDAIPSMYVYRQDFASHRKSYSRVGFIALMKLEPLGKGSVYPHERTLSKPKQDRLNLMRACNANFSPIFGLYDDGNKKVTAILRAAMKKNPVIDFVDWSKERNRVWVVNDAHSVQAIVAAMKPKKIFIADGHHRYETALTFSKEHPYANHVMIFLCDLNDKGLVVLPTHRVVKLNGMDMKTFLAATAQYFDVTHTTQQTIAKKLDEQYRKKHIAFGLYNGKTWDVLSLKNNAMRAKFVKGSKAYRALDVAVLEGIVFKHILKFSQEDIALQKFLMYVNNMQDAVSLVKKKTYDAAFIMNPTRVTQIKDVALNGETMPQKSTFFYPKLLTGMVVNQL